MLQLRQRKLFGFPLYRAHVGTGEVQSNILWLASRAIRFLLYRWSWSRLVREIARECRRGMLRIGTIYKSGFHRQGLVLGVV
ncbi:MAG: hypothetical protein WB347_21340, partial [Terriglobales bacterium]